MQEKLYCFEFKNIYNSEILMQEIFFTNIDKYIYYTDDY
jgi:hypothetical protein